MENQTHDTRHGKTKTQHKTWYNDVNQIQETKKNRYKNKQKPESWQNHHDLDDLEPKMIEL